MPENHPAESRSGAGEETSSLPIYVPLDAYRTEDEIDLLDLLETLFRNWLIIACCTLLAGGAAAAYVFSKPRVFKAKVTLSIPPGAHSEFLESLRSVESNGLQHSLTLAGICKPYFLKRRELEALFEQHGIRHASGTRYTGDEILAQDLVALSSPNDAMAVNVSVTLPDAKLAAQVADQFVRKGLEQMQGALSRQDDERKNRAEARLTEVEREYEARQETLVRLRKEYQPEALRSELQALTLQRDRAQKSLLDSEQDALVKEARVTSRESVLADTPKTVSLTRTLADSPEMLESLAQKLKAPPAEIMATRLVSEEVNPTYRELMSDQGQDRVTLKGLRILTKQYRNRIEEMNTRIIDLQEKLAESKVKLESATLDLGLAKASYESTHEELWEATDREWKRQPLLIVVDQADPPRKPESRRGALVLTGAMMAALFASCFGVLLRNAFQQRKAAGAQQTASQ